jgi:hypothetical protein
VQAAVRAYFDLIYQELDCYGTWLPGTGVAIGDIGRISQSGTFQRTGSLSGRAELPPTLAVAEPPQTISTRQSVTFSVGGDVHATDVVQAIAAADVKLDVSFGDATAAALILEDVTRHEFAEEQPVRDLMKTLLAAGKIADDEVVVTYVKEAGSGVVAASFDGTKGTDDSASAGLNLGTMSLARVGGRLKVVARHGAQTVVTAEPGRPLTPVYRALAFQRNRAWWSFWRSSLELRPVIPTRSFGDDEPRLDAILGDRPSLAVPRGQAD